MDENRFEIRIALTRAILELFSSADVVAWAKAGHGCDLAMGGPRRHVGTGLGQDVDGGTKIDARDLIESSEELGVGFDLVVDFQFDLGDGALEAVDLIHLDGDQLLSVGGDGTGEGIAKLRDLLAQTAASQFGEQNRVGRALTDAVEHVGSGNAEQVRCHRGELDTGDLEMLFDTILLAGSGLDEGSTIAGELSELAELSIRYEAGLDQTMTKQFGQPLGVGFVGLSSRHVHDVLGVADHDLHVALQRIVDRHPIHPGAFHQHVSDPQFDQLLPHLNELVRERSKLEFDLMKAVSLSDQDTDVENLLMNVYACTSLMKHIHP